MKKNKTLLGIAIVVIIGSLIYFIQTNENLPQNLNKNERKEWYSDKYSKEIKKELGDDVLVENSKEHYNKYSVNKSILKQKYPKYNSAALSFTRWKANAVNPSSLTTYDNKYLIEFNQDYSIKGVYQLKKEKLEGEEYKKIRKKLEERPDYKEYSNYKIAKNLDSEPGNEYDSGVIKAYKQRQKEPKKFNRIFQDLKNNLELEISNSINKVQKDELEDLKKDNFFNVIKTLELM